MPWLLEKKFWPTVSRIDDGRSQDTRSEIFGLILNSFTAYGDTHLIVSSASH